MYLSLNSSTIQGRKATLSSVIVVQNSNICLFLFRHIVGLRTLPVVLNEWILRFDRMLPVEFYYPHWTDSKNVSIITESIKQFYFGENGISLGQNFSDVSLTNMYIKYMFFFV